MGMDDLDYLRAKNKLSVAYCPLKFVLVHGPVSAKTGSEASFLQKLPPTPLIRVTGVRLSRPRRPEDNLHSLTTPHVDTWLDRPCVPREDSLTIPLISYDAICTG